MNIGYPCLNNSIPLKLRTFRLKSYSEDLLKEIVKNNLTYTKECLKFNLEHKIGFFRFSSDIVPFGSHPIATFDWKKEFKKEFEELGEYVRKHKMRISFHPDQFVVLNSKSEAVIQNGIKELQYHADMFNLMKLDATHKIQIHVGGLFGDKEASTERFIKTYEDLPKDIQDRLVIENDDRLFSLKDCLVINKRISLPILFDNFHHECLNNGESMKDAFSLASATWKEKDGHPMMDYSSQQEGNRKGAHTTTIDIKDFKTYKKLYMEHNVDLMLEIKDKEISALKALEAYEI